MSIVVQGKILKEAVKQFKKLKDGTKDSIGIFISPESGFFLWKGVTAVAGGTCYITKKLPAEVDAKVSGSIPLKEFDKVLSIIDSDTVAFSAQEGKIKVGEKASIKKCVNEYEADFSFSVSTVLLMGKLPKFKEYSMFLNKDSTSSYGALFTPKGLFCTDHKQLFHNKIKVKARSPEDLNHFFIPAEILKGVDGDVLICDTNSEDYFCLVDEDSLCCFIPKKAGEDFPEQACSFDTGSPEVSILIERKPLLKALKDIKKIQESSDQHIDLFIEATQGLITITFSHAEAMVSYEDCIKCDATGKTIKLSCSPEYFKNMVDSVKDDNINIGLYSKGKGPMSTETEDLKIYFMPIRFGGES